MKRLAIGLLFFVTGCSGSLAGFEATIDGGHWKPVRMESCIVTITGTDTKTGATRSTQGIMHTHVTKLDRGCWWD